MIAAGEIILQRWTRFLFGACITLLNVALAAGQTSAPSPPAPQSGKKPVTDAETIPGNPKRLFGFIPNSRTVNDTGSPILPLTAEKKFGLMKDYFTPFTLVKSAFGAGLGQAANSHPGYGQGWEGYGKRVGADLADALTGELFVTGVFPSLLHEDPRYFRQGHGSTSSRILYAATRVVVTRTDSGHHTFNFSELFGDMASSGIANSYYPRNERGWDDVMSRAGISMGGNALRFVAREFGPDIMRKFKRKKHPQEEPPAIGIPVKN